MKKKSSKHQEDPDEIKIYELNTADVSRKHHNQSPQKEEQELKIYEVNTVDNQSEIMNSDTFQQRDPLSSNQKKTTLSKFQQQQKELEESKDDDSQSNILKEKQGIKQKPLWQASWHYRFIQFWQTIFNRRLISFSCFALQIGDIVIFSAVVGYLVFCCLQETDTSSSGEMASVLMAVTVVFGCRNGLLSYFFGLSLERAVLWHQLLAWITLGLSLNHWFHSDSIASGYIVQGPLMGLLAFSLAPIRRYLWELFMKMHWLLIIVLIVGCIAHGVTISLFGLGYFALDVAYRAYTVYTHRNVSKEMRLERIGANITKISLINTDCNFKGGQYFFVMIPKLSYFQWHPFSVFSASFEEEVVIYVKTLGDWTGELYKLAGEAGKPTIVKGYLEGPYGYHSISIEGDKYKNFLCISGGIGVTPIISTAKELLHQMDMGRPVKNLHFIWTGRDSAIVESIVKPDELKSLLNQDDAQILKTFYHYSDKGNKKIVDLEQEALKQNQKIVPIDKGRPDFSKYFQTAFESAKKSGHHLVGVLTCGPQQLIDTVEINSSKWSKEGIRFDCHQEVFNF